MKTYFDRDNVTIFNGDCREVLRGLEPGSVHCCVTSPPYHGLRDYGCDGQIGLERSVASYVEALVEVFRLVRTLLRDDGTLFVNLGDRWEDKQLLLIPSQVALALQRDGWILRSEIIWHKLNPMPSSVKDRPTLANEQIFMLSKSRRYYFDWEAIAEPCVESNAARPRMGQGPNTKYAQKRRGMKMPDGWDTGPGAHGTYHRNGREKGRQNAAELPEKRNKRSVWSVPIEPCPDAHFATFPRKLMEPCILAGCPEGGTVLDPFFGRGTTGTVAQRLGRKCIGIELNQEYCELAARQFDQQLLFT